MRGMEENLSDPTVALSQYDILLCSETLVSEIRHMSKSLVPDLVALSGGLKARCFGPERWMNTYEIVTEHFSNPNLILWLLLNASS